MKNVKLDKTNSTKGHRKRLREKFLKVGLNGFHDYEVIELLLTLGTPRKDCKLIAKEVLKKFGSFNNVLDAPIEKLVEVNGVGPINVFGLKLSQAVSEMYQKRKIEKSLKLDSPEKIYQYLKEKIGKKQKEFFVVLFFDTQNNLIVDDVSVGTLNESLVHPREVFNKAVRCSASHIVVGHNHPSGDHKPSQEDMKTTRRLIEAGKIIGISLIDHVIVSKKGYTSLRRAMAEDFKN